jgi:hypothetical protein
MSIGPGETARYGAPDEEERRRLREDLAWITSNRFIGLSGQLARAAAAEDVERQLLGLDYDVAAHCVFGLRRCLEDDDRGLAGKYIELLNKAVRRRLHGMSTESPIEFHVRRPAESTILEAGKLYLAAAFVSERTPHQEIADLCGADDPKHLFNVLVENRRGRLNRVSEKDQAIVHRYHLLVGAIYVTGGDPLEDNWDEGDDWCGSMDPFEFELMQYDELIEDLDEAPILPAELATARRLMPVMKALYASTYGEAKLRSRAEMGPGVGKHRSRCDGWDRARCRAGIRTRERGARGGRPVRVRGSRRITRNSQRVSRSGDDPGGEPEPAPSRWPTKAAAGRLHSLAPGATS